MVVLVCVLAPLAAPFLRRSASVSACFLLRGSTPLSAGCPHRRGKVSHRLTLLEDGLEHEIVEALLLDLDVCCGRGHHCRRAAGPSVSLRFCCSSAARLPSLLMAPRLALVSISCVLPVASWLSKRLGMSTQFDRRAGKDRCVKRACA